MADKRIVTVEYLEEYAKGLIDQTYTPDSENAQSGKAVAAAITDKFGITNAILEALINGSGTNFFDLSANGTLSLKSQYEPNGSNYNDLPEVLTLPSTVNNIAVNSLADSFLKDNRNIKVVILPNITIISNSAFENTNIEFILGMNNITAIGEKSFAHSWIRYIDLTSVSSIGNSAFMRCGRLEKVTLNDTITTLPFACFCLCNMLKTVEGGSNITTFYDGAFSNTDNLVNADGIITALSNERTITIGKSAFNATSIPFDWASRNYNNDILHTTYSTAGVKAELDATVYQKWNGDNRGLYNIWIAKQSILTNSKDLYMPLKINQWYYEGISPKRNIGSYIAEELSDNSWKSLYNNGECLFISFLNVFLALKGIFYLNDISKAELELYYEALRLDNGVQGTHCANLKEAIRNFNGSGIGNSISPVVPLANALEIKWKRYYLENDETFTYCDYSNQTPIAFEGGYSAFISSKFYEEITDNHYCLINCMMNTDTQLEYGNQRGYNHVINVCGYKRNGDIEIYNNSAGTPTRGINYCGYSAVIKPQQIMSYFNSIFYFYL